LSALIFGTAIMVGPAFYNGVLIPVGLTLLLITALTPLTRWGRAPSVAQRKWWIASSGAAGAGLVAAVLAGVRQPMALAIAGLAALAVAAFAGSLWLDAPRRDPARIVDGLRLALRAGRRQYAGFVIHLGLIALAVGVAGSSLGKREQSFSMTEGQTVAWAGRTIRLDRVIQRELPDKLVAEAVLEISRGSGRTTTLVPAQHYHKLQQEWTTEVAIDSTWRGDFYTILHSGTADGRLLLTLIENPLMRWLWMGGAVMVLGTCVRLFSGPAAVRAAGRELAVKWRTEPAIRRRVVRRWVRGWNLRAQI
jgi:cytochrome c-type biogenesis protein CcmF